MALPGSFRGRPGDRHSPTWFDTPSFGSLTILENSAIGGQAVVCKVKLHNQPTRIYALKVYKRNRTRRSHIVQMNQELKARFTDPHFLTPVAACQISSIRDAILLPWVDGTTLMNYIRENPQTAQRLRLMREIADAVAYLHHEALWLHNDLKPSNIMVVDSGQSVDIRIIDLSLGCSIAEVDNLYGGRQEFLGIEQWVAPELHISKGNGIQRASVQSDVWALGCILLFILTGKDLWDYIGVRDKEPIDHFLDICRPRFERKEPITDFQSLLCQDQLKDIISNCLNVDSNQRPPVRDVACLLRAL